MPLGHLQRHSGLHNCILRFHAAQSTDQSCLAGKHSPHAERKRPLSFGSAAPAEKNGETTPRQETPQHSKQRQEGEQDTYQVRATAKCLPRPPAGVKREQRHDDQTPVFSPTGRAESEHDDGRQECTEHEKENHQPAALHRGTDRVDG